MLGRPVIRFEVVSSTMDVLAQLAARGAPEGTVVVAGYQTHGRGRSDRRWSAPAGTALLHSVLMRPPLAVQQLSPLSILVADAIVATLRERHGVQAQIKWPNDVLVGGKKISGILIQTRHVPNTRFPAVLVGAGINANVSQMDLPEGGTSLLVETGQRVDLEGLMRGFLDRLEPRYHDLSEQHLDDRWEHIHNVLAMRGEHVSVVDGGVTTSGRLLGIDTTGALLLETDDQEPCRIVVGDLTRGPRRASRR
jgi:BirA family transcriptional regulator, biotin operon repressor / biotin---[acetyl-CoA-carboxylase] ligase